MAARRLRVPRLSEKESIVLALLIEHQQMYGLELVAASPRDLKRGTIYVTLGRMEEKGYVTSKLEDAPPHAGGLPRRIYRSTAQGRQIFTVWNRALTELAPRFAR
jgi:PadR family transcriptional regulator, regulatory protein PadR